MEFRPKFIRKFEFSGTWKFFDSHKYDITSDWNQLMNADIFGALFILSLSIPILNSQCEEGVKSVSVHLLTPII